MTNDDAPPGESFYERAQTLNANLQRLNEVISGVLSASGDLLVRLQHRLSGAAPAGDGAEGPHDQTTPPPGDRDQG